LLVKPACENVSSVDPESSSASRFPDGSASQKRRLDMKTGSCIVVARIGSRTLACYRHPAILAMAALAPLVLCGAMAPTGCAPAAPPPSHSGAEVAGVAILVGAAVGTVVLVELHHSSHSIEGCVTAGQNGIQVQNLKDKRIYTLAGATASTTVGDIVRLHGDREKQTKGDTADPTFVVEKVTRDLGPCKLGSSPTAFAGHPTEVQDAE
jgi:hypothetical protein